MVLPIESGRACDDIRVRQDWGVAVGCKILACFKHQDAALWIGALQVARDGISTGASKDAARAEMHGSEVTMRVDLGLGDGAARSWGCDLTEAYVIENSAYST